MNNRQIPAEWLPNYTYADYEAWEGDWELIRCIPYAVSPSAKRLQQSIGRKIILLFQEVLNQNRDSCDCEIYYELDWIVDESAIVRPDVMLVFGAFEDDFLRFPPSLVIEITSRRTQMADRNVKFKIYESQRVPYYLIVDPERKTTEIFQLLNQQYQAVQTSSFLLDETCRIAVDMNRLWSVVK